MKGFNTVLLIAILIILILFNTIWRSTVVVDKIVEKEVLTPVLYRSNFTYEYVDPISKDDALDMLEEFKSTHDYYIFIHPQDIEFHARVSARYQQLINYIAEEGGN